MTETKQAAIETLDELHRTIPYDDYCTIHDSLTEIETLREQDSELKELWSEFGDIPINPETECIEERFMGWGVGTHREEIWRWFDDRYSNGVAYLLYGGDEDYVPEARRLYGLLKLCFECESTSCQFNHGGECRFALVHERKPRINDYDGCIGYDYKGGD